MIRKRNQEKMNQKNKILRKEAKVKKKCKKKLKKK
jgi:hypothetical protein